MRVFRIEIENFRGIKLASLILPHHALLIGDNNTGKSTVLEALDLVLGPDRLNRRPPVDEHDFYNGLYRAEPAPAPVDGAAAVPAVAPVIKIEVTITDLSEEQLGLFGDHIEWLNLETGLFYVEAVPQGVDAAAVAAALRITFVGSYDEAEDDFVGQTSFSRSLEDGGPVERFSKTHKQHCGFLYLRSVRTGSRALSLEHGSLLDIILRLKELRPKMWEDTIAGLSTFDVASDPALGISGVLDSIDTSLKNYVPREWGARPHLRVSNLTREHLRKVVTAFIATGEGDHAAPYYRQGTGTINMLVLAMLSQIAQDKQNVIFAMEEAETAIPPYAQKRIVHELRKLSAQAIFTSHSPYVLEEFDLEDTVILSRDVGGSMTQAMAQLPASVKPKRYRQEFRTRFCEGLLSRRVLLAEGATEASTLPAAARRLSELNPRQYRSLEALGITVIDAGSETQLADLAGFYRGLGKQTFGLCDKQDDAAKAAIEATVDRLFMHGEKGIEDLVLKTADGGAIARFALGLDWPPHLQQKFPDPVAHAPAALSEYFGWAKGAGGLADFVAQCTEAEMPPFLRDTCTQLGVLCDPPVNPQPPAPGLIAADLASLLG